MPADGNSPWIQLLHDVTFAQPGARPPEFEARDGAIVWNLSGGPVRLTPHQVASLRTIFDREAATDLLEGLYAAELQLSQPPEAA